MRRKILVLVVGMVVVSMVSVSKGETRYQFVDLGTLGGDWSAAYGINDAGQIIGGSGTNWGPNRATLFDATGRENNIDLGSIGFFGSSIAMDINNSGKVVGYGGPAGVTLAILFDLANPSNNFSLGTLGGSFSEAYDVNSNGQIVGRAWHLSGDCHATLFDPTGNGDNIDLGVLSGIESNAQAINDAGQIIGWAKTAANYYRATLFDSGGGGVNKALDLTPYSIANGINSSGQIVGVSVGRAISFNQFDISGNVYLSSPYGEAYAINDRGQIVGYMNPATGGRYATLFDPTGNGNNIDLNSCTINKPSGWILKEARDINKKGWIVGEGQNPEGQRRAFLLFPQKTLENVPQYRWNHGCAPTAAGILMAYWDKKFPNLVDGDPPLVDMTSESKPRTDWRPWHYVYEPNYGDPTANRLIATQEHFNDWWDDNVLIPGWDDKDDPLPSGTPHPDNCLADFLGTSRGNLGNGATTPDPQKIAQALRNWAYYKGYTMQKGYSVVVGDNRSPTFNDLKAEIDRGKPVLLCLTLDGKGGKGHSVIAYGYRDGRLGDQWYAVMDTWLLNDPHLLTQIKSEISDLGIEWWLWSADYGDIAAVGYMNTFSILATPTPLIDAPLSRFVDSFNRILGEDETIGSLGYSIVDSSSDQSGQVVIVDSPLGVGNPALKMVSATGEPISAAITVDASKEVTVAFQYLFDNSGKIDILLDGIILDTLHCPTIGPGSPGSVIFGDYFHDFDIESLGLGIFGSYDFQLSLSGSGDPTTYIDNLFLTSVPEPGTILFIILGGVLISAKSRL